tara:strand:+ start:1126 stop:1872 length:747 start_codon:yes stop_codon:yes gene_type:complete
MVALPQADFAKLPTFVQDAFKKSFGQAANIADRPVNVGAMAPGLDPLQQQAGSILQQGLGSFQPFLEKATSYAGPGGAQAFMNPYTQNVVDNTVQQLNKQFDLQKAQANERAIGSGAFAGSGTRQAVFDAALAGEQANTLRNTVGDLYNQGFTQSQQAAQNAAQNFMNLGQQGQTQRLADVNALFNFGGAQRQTGIDAANLAYQKPMDQSLFLSSLATGAPQFSRLQMPNPMQMGIAGFGAGTGLFGR